MTWPLNRLAPHQPPAASNKYGPCLFKRHNRAEAAKQPPANRGPPTLLHPSSHYKTSWSAPTVGHSCIRGSFPSTGAHPDPNWQDVCVSGEQILPLA